MKFIKILFFLCLLFSGAVFAGDKMLFQVGPEVVFYSGDHLRSFTAGGAVFEIRPLDEWSFFVEALLGKVSSDVRLSPLLADGDRMLVVSGGVQFNTPALFGDKNDPWRAELYTSFGPALMWMGDSKSAAGFLGGGMNVYTAWKHLAIRFDLKSYFYSMRNDLGSDFCSDISFNIGPVFIF